MTDLMSKLEQIRSSQEYDRILIKAELKNIFNRKISHISKNLTKYRKKFIEAEIKKKRRLRFWNNRYLKKPKHLGNASAEEMMKIVEEIVEEEKLYESLSQLFEHQIDFEWHFRPNIFNFEGRTVPQHFYFSMKIIWFDREVDEEVYADEYGNIDLEDEMESN